MRRLQLIPHLAQPGKGAACHILVPPGRHGHKPLHTNSLKLRKLAHNRANLIGRKPALGLLAAHVDLYEDMLRAGKLASLDLADRTTRDGLRQMQRAYRVNQLGRAQNRINLVGLQVADHIEAHLGQFRMLREAGKLADELLRAILGKMTIPSLNGSNGLIDANGL